MTTATDKLRRMLDERGVEWVASGTDTCWKSADGYPMRAWDTTNGTHMRVADLTPEQAIAATLGAGTCKVESMHGYKDDHTHTSWCVELSFHTLDAWEDSIPPSYCPICGARVVE